MSIKNSTYKSKIKTGTIYKEVA